MRVPKEGDQPSNFFIHLSCEYYTRCGGFVNPFSGQTRKSFLPLQEYFRGQER
jgi:hypothetical protein